MKNQSSNSKSILSFIVVVLLAFVAFYLGKSSPKENTPIQDNAAIAPQSAKKILPSELQQTETAEPVATEDATIVPDTQQREIPADFKAQLDSLPPELPEDLKQQMMNPPTDLPEDLKAQLNSPPPPIPDDIKRAMETPPRVVTEAEVNDPNWEPGQ